MSIDKGFKRCAVRNNTLNLVFSAIVMLLACGARAEDLTDRFGVGGSMGAAVPVGSKRITDRNDTGLGGGGWLYYGLDENWGARLSYDNLKFDRGTTRMEPLTLSLAYSLAPESFLNPFVRVGFGADFVSGDAVAKRHTLAGYSAGVGVDSFLTKSFSVGAALDYFGAIKSNPAVYDVHALRAGLTAGLWFGKGPEEAVIQMPTPEAASVAAASAAPAGLAGTALGVSSIKWTWSALAGAESYNLYEAAKPASLIASTAAAPCTITGLSPNTAYGVVVAGVVFAKPGPLSAEASVYTLAAPPSGLSLVSVSSSSATLQWSRNDNPKNTSFDLDYWSEPGSKTKLTLTAENATVSGLSAGTAYFFQVQAKNGDGIASAAAGPLTVVTPAAEAVVASTAPAQGVMAAAEAVKRLGDLVSKVSPVPASSKLAEAVVRAVKRLEQYAAPNTITPGVVQAVKGAATDPACPWGRVNDVCMLAMEFDYNHAALQGAFLAQLNEISVFMKANSKATIEIQGHTDSRGSQEYNLKLSKQRAQTVVDYLAGQGIDRSRMKLKGFGKSKLTAAEDTDAGRQRNRRGLAVLEWPVPPKRP